MESYVCMGYEQGASVTCLAFEAAGSLLVGVALVTAALAAVLLSRGSVPVLLSSFNHGAVSGAKP